MFYPLKFIYRRSIWFCGGSGLNIDLETFKHHYVTNSRVGLWVENVNQIN